MDNGQWTTIIMNDNYEPCFYDVSDDWQERWALIREFTTRWHGIQFRDRQELLPLVKREEDKLGFKLPPSFQEYIIFSADIDCNRENRFIKDSLKIQYSLLTHKTRRVIRDDYVVEYFKKLSAISLLRLSEGDAFWGIKADNLTQTDPPVETYMLNDVGRNSYDYYALTGTIKEDGFKYGSCCSPSITDFIFSSMLFFLYGNKNSYAKFRENNYQLIRSLESIFGKKIDW